MTDDGDEIDRLLAEIDPLVRGDPAAALRRLDALPPALAADPELLYQRGLASLELDDREGARAALEQAVAADPRFADAHHLLGQLSELAGDRQAMIARWREVRLLDARSDRARGLGRVGVRERISATALEVLARLPEHLRERLHNVPVVLEPRPSRSLVDEGFDPRALGLFEGPDDFGQRSIEAPPAPSRIVLFYCNLEASFPEPARLAEEVEVTILHEIGHYFGLDEDGVDRLGLA